MSTEEQVSYRDKLRELIEEMLNSGGGGATVLTAAVMLVRDAELDRLSQENDRLAARVTELDGLVDDYTKQMIENGVRAERAEAQLAEAQKKIEELPSGRWFHLDGTECVAGHAAETMMCAEGGGRVVTYGQHWHLRAERAEAAIQRSHRLRLAWEQRHAARMLSFAAAAEALGRALSGQPPAEKEEDPNGT